MAFLREIRGKRKSGKVYSYWVIIKTFWDKKRRKVRHRLLHNLGTLSQKEVRTIRTVLSLKGKIEDYFFTRWQDIKTKQDYEYLVPVLLDKLWHLWELDKVTASGEILKVSTSIISEILAINRAIAPSSDFKVCTWYERTILPKIFNVSPELVNPTRIYRSLDQILPLESRIQDHLAKRVEDLGFDDLSLIFYDITSSYFEGWSCPLGEFGLSRDYRKDRLQLLLALAVTKEGFPFYWKVLPGGIHDSTTVKSAATSLKERFPVNNITLVMDKGMVSKDNLNFLEKEGFSYIVTIPRSSVKKLPDFPKELLKEIGKELEEEDKKKSPDLKGVMEKYPYLTYPEQLLHRSFYSGLPRAYYHELNKEKKRRYILCFNPEKFLEERGQRKKKLASIKNYLERWNKELLSAKKSKNKELLGKKIYFYLKKRKTENLFTIKLFPKRKRIKNRTITTYKIDYQIREDKLESLKLSDGIYCLLSNLPKDKTGSFLVSAYRQRRKVEVAFSYLKGFIEIRPFYHQKEERVKAHILTCILGYLLQVTTEYLLKKRGYNITFQEFYQKASRIRAVELEIENIRKKGLKLTKAPKEVVSLLEMLDSKEILSEDLLKTEK